MATNPMPQPSAGASPQAGGASPEANPLQTALAQLARVCEQIGQQNPIVQAEMTQARQACIQGLQKTMMAARPEQPESPAPQTQGQ